MYTQITTFVGRTAQARAARAREARNCPRQVETDGDVSQGKKLIASAVRDVSSEFDMERESDKP